ncbi:MAG: hypothetical protein ACRDPP_14305 [Gaiellaceae bacterium]
MRIALALTAAGLAGGGAVAVAQGGDAGPAAEREAFLEDAAERLGVEPDELETALEEAAVARVDEAVESGRLTEAQAAELKERIRAGEAGLPGLGLRGGPPWPGGPEHRGFGHGPGLFEPAADYLGLEGDELRDRLSEGDSLAEIAEAEDKEVDGLVDALVAAARERLDEALEEGRLGEAERDEMVERIRERVDALVQDGLPGRAPHGRWGDRESNG